MIAEPRGAVGRAPIVASAALLASLALLSMCVVAGRAVAPAAALVLVVVLLTTSIRWLLAWRTLLAATVLVILFIPIRRYALPGSLPFQLEPYRLLIAFVALVWLSALLIDRRVRLRRSVLDGPMIAIFLVAAASIAENISRIEGLHVTQDAIKQLTFLASFLIVFFLVVSLSRRIQDVDFLLRLLAGGGAVVAIGGIVQRSTGFNVFNHLDIVIPGLTQVAGDDTSIRGGAYRAVASAQHPIALGAALVLLIPIALYLLAKYKERRWIGVAVLLAMGALASASRTAVTMLITVVVVYLILRTKETVRLWPALIPVLAVVHVAMPGVIGGFYKAFFPSQGLVAEQADAQVGSSRVASLGPGLHVIGLHPLLGVGYGSRISTGPEQNSFIVDDQWLSTGMDTGIAGELAWVWLFTAFLRRTWRRAREDVGDTGWLFTALTASVWSFVIGMLTFDAFSFIQATFFLFILLALGCAALNLTRPGLRAAADPS